MPSRPRLYLARHAQTQFDAQVEAAKKAAGGNGAMGQFLRGLNDLQALIRDLNVSLVEYNKEQRELLDGLAENIAQKNADRLKKIWDADPNLAKWQPQLAIAEHHYNVAIAANLPEDARRLKTEIGQLHRNIKATQDLLESQDLYKPEVSELQKAVEKSVKLMEQARGKYEAQIQEVFTAMEKAKPDMAQLPAEQQALARQLDDSSKALNDARANYSRQQDDINAKTDATVQSLASHVAAQQAKIDDRKAQLARLLAKETPTSEQFQQKQAELAVARSQRRRQPPTTTRLQQFTDCQVDARRATDAANRLSQEYEQRQALSIQKRETDAELASMGTQLLEPAEPEKPDESSVIAEGDFPRKRYLLYVLSSGCLLATLTVLLTRRALPAWPRRIQNRQSARYPGRADRSGA